MKARNWRNKMWSGQRHFPRYPPPPPLLNYSQISVLDLLPKATNFQKTSNFLIQSTMHVYTWISQKKTPVLKCHRNYKLILLFLNILSNHIVNEIMSSWQQWENLGLSTYGTLDSARHVMVNYGIASKFVGTLCYL